MLWVRILGAIGLSALTFVWVETAPVAIRRMIVDLIPADCSRSDVIAATERVNLALVDNGRIVLLCMLPMFLWSVLGGRRHRKLRPVPSREDQAEDSYTDTQ